MTDRLQQEERLRAQREAFATARAAKWLPWRAAAWFAVRIFMCAIIFSQLFVFYDRIAYGRSWDGIGTFLLGLAGGLTFAMQFAWLAMLPGLLVVFPILWFMARMGARKVPAMLVSVLTGLILCWFVFGITDVPLLAAITLGLFYPVYCLYRDLLLARAASLNSGGFSLGG